MVINKHTLSFFLLTVSFVFSSMIFASGPPNPNVKYVGYDWIDGEQGSTLPLSSAGFRSKIGHSTNMNIVRTLELLNSDVCKDQKCAFNISAGISSVAQTGLNRGDRKDICVDASNYTECLQANPWHKIWEIVGEISNATNKPRAIYFIDEPEIAKALTDGNGKYIRHSYSSFVCTLNMALRANGLEDVSVFTILTADAAIKRNRLDIIKDIKYQMPRAGCSNAKSTPDWIGFDNYAWQYGDGRWKDKAWKSGHDIFNHYNSVFPNNGTNPLWVIVPPATDHTNDSVVNDVKVTHPQLQTYWDFMWMYPDAPAIAYMYFRFNPNVTVEGHINGYDPHVDSRALFRYMSNRIVNGTH